MGEFFANYEEEFGGTFQLETLTDSGYESSQPQLTSIEDSQVTGDGNSTLVFSNLLPIDFNEMLQQDENMDKVINESLLDFKQSENLTEFDYPDKQSAPFDSFHHKANVNIGQQPEALQHDVVYRYLNSDDDNDISLNEDRIIFVDIPITIQLSTEDIHHSKIERKCYKCNKTFTNFRYLKQHNHACHNGTISCEICGKKFKRESDLVEHVKKHSKKEKPFKCQYCEKSYIHNGDLKRHEAEKHDPSKCKFVCTICHKRFTRKDRMLRHQKTHAFKMQLGQ